MKKKLLTFSLLSVAAVAITTAGISLSKIYLSDTVEAVSSYSVVFDKDSCDLYKKDGTDKGYFVYDTTSQGNNVFLQLRSSKSTFIKARELGFLAKKSSDDNNFHIILLPDITGFTVSNVNLYNVKSVVIDYEMVKDHEGTSYNYKEIDFRPQMVDASTTWKCVVSDIQPNVAYAPADGTATNKSSTYSAFDIGFYGNHEVNINSITINYECSK